ncbi:hypothetical protein GCM10010435_14000 [Winogradskya consettensis]|uniref:Uncharacterized protein n=1 Tax=Winogradskya consettensis TaxID=113560 RepID=A0A919VMG9_9ACTN|nr:hypothetical protein [Actinoplanes consettensis]GIM69002.1 hypothetical protein Aco04nite_13270 [Actinoplanes consettensis]
MRLGLLFDVGGALFQEAAQVWGQQQSGDYRAEGAQWGGDRHAVGHAGGAVAQVFEEVLVVQGAEGAAGLFVDEAVWGARRR